MTVAAVAPRGPRVWLLAARPATLPAAVTPVIVGTAAALHGGYAPRMGPFAAALLAALLIQIGTNFANDVFDFHRGADSTDRLGPLRVTQSGFVSPGQVLAATYVTFGLAVLVGLYLVLVGGWPILLIGVLSILAGLAYTGGPWPYAYHALGDLFVFVFFGVLAVIGSAYLQTGTITPLALWAAIPTGCLVTAILVVNNLRDIETDRQVNKVTLAVRLGRQATRREYALLVAVAYLVPALLWLQGLVGGWFWLPYLSVPLAVWLVRFIARAEGRPLNRALKGTGQVHLVFGLLFAASVWLP
ncbi:MAG: 1,4-dihydroxy-2-naphthoate polyprenyltransferase [Chloroflexota bacterium]|nr:1,4-dihydroxy-2-naphthoate polyprenyltransferase [Chloroflexota bacterium]